MNGNRFLLEYVSWLFLLPAAVLCLLPLRNRLRYRLRSLLLAAAVLLLLVLIPACSLLACLFPAMNPNRLILLAAALLFALYQKSVRTHPSKTMAFFLFVSALMGFLSNYTNCFDAYLHPNAGWDFFSVEAGLFQFGISVLAAALLAWPLWRYGAWLADSFESRRVWSAAALVSCVFLGLNVALIIHNYQTLYTNRVFPSYLAILSLLLLLFLMLAGVYYFLVSEMLRKAQAEARNRILEMQEKQYTIQQSYIEATAKARHDFRQTIRTLYQLSQARDYAALNRYLEDYVRSLPKKEVIYYCKNSAVNALLNYYVQEALQSEIELTMRVDPLEDTEITDIDLCSVLGNLLDNSIAACRTVSEGRRWIDLGIVAQTEAVLCIVATNSFDGQVRQQGGQYLSIHRDSTGLGLVSILSIAEKYGGTARFYHKDKEFYSDVILKMRRG